MEYITIRVPGGPALEGRLAVPPSPAGGVVLCHPHPQYEGSMSSVLIPPLQRAIVNAGWAALRFNFRGVGRSEGSFDGGEGEVDDARAALERVAADVPGLPVAVVGWSFGSIVGLRAALRDDRVVAYAGIAPPVSWSATGEVPSIPADVDAFAGRALLVCGTEDPFCKPRDLTALAARFAHGEARVFEGADHFFSIGRDEMIAAVASFVTAA